MAIKYDTEEKRVRQINKMKFNRKRLSRMAMYRRLKRLYRHLPSKMQKYIIDVFFKHLNERPWGVKKYHQSKRKEV